MRSLYLKEMNIYFSSPIFYIIAAIFVCITGVFFYNTMVYVSLLSVKIAQYQSSTGVSLNDILLRPIFSDMGLLILFIVPIISMRLYAEEKAQGTIELLFTYPVSDLQVLAAKYLSGLSVLVVMITLTFVFMLLIAMVTTPDWGVILSSYIGLILMGGAFLSLGVFASSMTKNQIVAAALSLGLIMLFWMIGWFSGSALTAGCISRVLSELSLISHLSHFLSGMIMIKDVTFFICFTLFFLFITLRVIDSNRWRG